jgi:uncharacterized protein
MLTNLHLTHACNIRCDYCYTGEKFGRHMSLDTARQAVDFAIKSSAGSVQFNFFGGEPLLQLPLMEATADYAQIRAKEAGLYLQFELTTNGTLIDQRACEFIQKNRVAVSLSIDGNSDAHDAHRVCANGNGSFDRVLEGLRALKEVAPLLMTLSVVSPDTVPHLTPSIRFLREEGIRTLLTTLDYTANWQAGDFRRLRKELHRLGDFYAEETLADRSLYLSIFDNKIRSHIRPTGGGSGCKAGIDTISVAPSGRIYPCVQFVKEDEPDAGGSDPYALGSVSDDFDEMKKRTFVAKADQSDSSCRGCALDGRCNNDCACLNLQTTGQPNRISPLLCEFERIVTPVADSVAERLYRERSPEFLHKHYNCLYPLLSVFKEEKQRGELR